MIQKELPLVVFLKQEIFSFFAPGFSLQPGLNRNLKKTIQNHSKLKYFLNLYFKKNKK